MSFFIGCWNEEEALKEGNALITGFTYNYDDETIIIKYKTNSSERYMTFSIEYALESGLINLNKLKTL